jgi:hypothetical protein
MISELGLCAQTHEGGDDVAMLVRAAREQGITYFHALDESADEVLPQGDVILGKLIAPDMLENVNDPRLEVLWVKAEAAEQNWLAEVVAQLKSLQAAGQIKTFGLWLAHLSNDEQIAAGRWAIAEDVPLLSITHTLHEPQVGAVLFPLVSTPDENEQPTTRFVIPLPKETTTLDHWLGEDLAELVSSAFARQTQQLRFLTENGRSLTQAAIQFALASPAVACVLPTITTLGDLQNCIAACDAPNLSRVELNRLDDLVKHGFHLEPFEPPIVYNG